MGKRKKSSRKPQGPKKKVTLATSFSCLFCNHENAVSVKMDKKAGVGQLSCKVCGQHFQTGINYLSAAVDVYSDWIDACDSVAKDAAGKEMRSGSRHTASGEGHHDLDDETMNGLIVDDDDDDNGQGDYDDN